MPKRKSAAPQAGQTTLHGIQVRGATTNGLNSIDCTIPYRSLTVITGASGTGKTSLAVHTIYAEARRRLALALHHRERAELERGPTPQFAALDGLMAAVNVNETAASLFSSAPVSSLLGIEEPLIHLALRCGSLSCGRSDCALKNAAPQAVIAEIAGYAAEQRAESSRALRLLVEACLHRPAFGVQKKKERGLPEEILRQLIELQQEGYRRFVLNGVLFELPALGALDEAAAAANPARRSGESAAAEPLAAAAMGAREQLLSALNEADWSSAFFSVVVDRAAFAPGNAESTERLNEAIESALRLRPGLCIIRQSDAGRPDQRPEQRAEPVAAQDVSAGRLWFSAHGSWCAVCSRLVSAQQLEDSQLERAAGQGTKPLPDGAGVHLRLGGESLDSLLNARADELAGFLERFTQEHGKLPAAEAVARELHFLTALGLGALPLSRPLHALSSGERYRLALALHGGTTSTELLYVLDEPSRTLHPAALGSLYNACRLLTAAGNAVLAVERSTDFVSAADHVIELQREKDGCSAAFSGPGALWRKGQKAGKPLRAKGRPLLPPSEGSLRLSDLPLLAGGSAVELSVELPFDSITALIGPSGSGKSQLLRDELYALHRGAKAQAGAAKRSQAASGGTAPGLEHFRFAAYLSAEPHGAGRGSAAGALRGRELLVWDACGLAEKIAALYAELPAARAGGLKQESFMLGAGGECPLCSGRGMLAVEEGTAEISAEGCPACRGSRFAAPAASVLYRERSITEVLSFDIRAALALFSARAELVRTLHLVDSLGLGRLLLGEPLSRIPHSAQQRLRLAELASRGRENETRLLLLDQVLAGLDAEEVELCMSRLAELRRRGSTILIVSHDPEVVSRSDFVLEIRAGKKIEFFGPSRDFPLDQFKKTSKFYRT